MTVRSEWPTPARDVCEAVHPRLRTLVRALRKVSPNREVNQAGQACVNDRSKLAGTGRFGTQRTGVKILATLEPTRAP